MGGRTGHFILMRLLAGLLSGCAAVFVAGTLWAGGSGFNVIVVANQSSTNSVRLANRYCELRGVPPQNLWRMEGWTARTNTWSRANFQAFLYDPLLAAIAARGLTNQAEFILLSMDIPYRVLDNDPYQTQNSTTAALFYGCKRDTAPPLICLPACCGLPDASSNSYAFSEMPFREAPPDTALTNAFLTLMLTASNLASAERILSRGVASDSTFPTQAVYLAKSSDPARSVRVVKFDNAIFASRVRGDYPLVRTNTGSTAFTNLLGLQTGKTSFTLPTNAFVAGAMADNLTSNGGKIFEDRAGQTALLAMLDAGAAGSYGTVVEPCAYTQKFPDPRNYVYQKRGFCLAEAYYQSLLNPYQGLLVGEPLAAPFARRGTADWNSLTNGAVLSGLALLTLDFTAADTNLPLSQVDLFVDGRFWQRMADLPPAAGNELAVTLNGIPFNYTVPTNATVASVAADLAAGLNGLTNLTHVQAWAVGDRLELQSLEVAQPGGAVTLSASTAAGSAAQLTTWLTPARDTFLDTTATGGLSLLASNTPLAGDWLQLDFIKTNGECLSLSVTNPAAGTDIATLVSNLVNRVKAEPALQSADGVLAADFADDTYCGIVAAEFTLYARSPGWPAAQFQVAFSASTNLLALPAGTNCLDANLNDLRPRNHLYVSSGAAALPVSFAFDTTRVPDGWHQLTAVAYEGTSVRTQTRVARTVRVQNTALAATFTPLLAGTNATLDLPLQFSVAANATNIARLELFSTGGAVGVVSNQSAAVFTAPVAALGLGLHPFYAVVTDADGNQYQTETISIRLVPPFRLRLDRAPLTLSWEATPGVPYDVLAATNLAHGFAPVASLTASNILAVWPVPVPGEAAAFYRVRLSP